MSPTARPHPGRLAAWRAASRPASLVLAAGPVLVGVALAARTAPDLSWGLAPLALLAALLMQLVTNLQNDVGFTARGGDRVSGRVGLPRATAEGWLRPALVRWAIVGLCLVSVALGGWLLLWRGWPVLLLGGSSLLAALAYMGGPRPIAYTAWGELTVLVFFGLVAVVGTQWLLGGRIGPEGLLAALAVGSLAAAAMAVNNHRDAEHDRRLGRRTFAVRFGPRRSLALFALLLGGPFVLLVPMAAWLRDPALLLPMVLVPRAVFLARALERAGQGQDCNPVLFGVFRLELLFAVLLAAALVSGAVRSA